jgi:heme A synthase
LSAVVALRRVFRVVDTQKPTGTPRPGGPSAGVAAIPAHARRDTAAPGLDGLGAAFLALVVPTFCLIVLGALVRAHEAGLACPDWPLCFGQVVPEFDLQVAFEWSHRVLAGGIALLFTGLLVAALRRPALPDAARRLLGLGAALLVVQILLGALTVWHLLASWTVTSHLLTGNAFALVLLLTGLCLREAASGRTGVRAAAGVRAALAVAALLLVLQVALGGLVSSRFVGLACPEWPTCNGGRWFPTWQGPVGLHLLHRWNGALVVVALGGVAIVARHTPGVRALGFSAAGLAVAQLGVGVANVLTGIPVEVTGLHSALATALVLCVGAAVWRAWRAPARPAAARL